MLVSRSEPIGFVEIAGLRPGGIETVLFPVHQPGISALVGFYEFEGGSYVIKVLKTAAIRRWAREQTAMQEPRYVKAVRRLSARWDTLAPRRAIFPVLERFNAMCQHWLGLVEPAALEEALSDVDGADASTSACLVSELFELRAELRFAPRTSYPVQVGIPDGGIENAFAIVQENVGSLKEPASALRVWIDRHGLRPRERASRLQLLALLAYAVHLANAHGLGLDLAPRLGTGGISVPNVLVRPAARGLVYVDYFGLAQRDGNSIEAAAFGALYGRRGAARQLSSRVYRCLTRSHGRAAV